MKIIDALQRLTIIIFILILVPTSSSSVLAISSNDQSVAHSPPEDPVVARIYFNDPAELDRMAAELDIWEMHRAQGYLIAMISPTQLESYLRNGYRIEVDVEKTALLNKPLDMLPSQLDGIPGYPCYRTVEETYTDIANIAILNPVLASWIDIGDSWEKITPGGLDGYDIFSLVLTNKNIPGPKPIFFLMAEIHAREYTTAELAARFAEFLVANYGSNPDVTWLLDYFEVHIVPMTNPDGRKLAEAGNYWRKNTDNDDGCTNPSSWGTDLNRNHSFKWDMGGSSDFPCETTYHGPSAASEPETQAIQNYVMTLFPDQRGPGDNDPAPDDTTGVFITLHSYSELVLWPWGWTPVDSPNHSQLRTLGRKFAYFNDYTAQQSNDLYPTSGTSDEWAYGELGIAAYTFELGTTFFQGCTTFENTIVPDNMPALVAAFKAARRPYMNPSGPDSLDVTVDPDSVIRGQPVSLTAAAHDTRFSSGEPSQDIQAARYSFDDPSWITGTPTIPMSAADGSFDGSVEDVIAVLDTTGLSAGQHTIFVEGQDADGNWGSPSAVFLSVTVPDYGAELLPENDQQQADPGQVVTYTMQVENYGANPDTYDITLDTVWSAAGPASIGPVSSGEGTAFDVTVTIPLSATNGESDMATVRILSQNDPVVSDSSSLETIANYYDLSFTPPQDAKYGLAGTDVVYTLEVVNLGNLPDSYNLIANGTWSIVAPSSLGPLEPGESTSFEVTVSVPGSAQPGDSDLSSLTITSQGNAAKSASAELVTTAGLLGPLVSPTEITKYGDPDTYVEFTLTITNASDKVDNFNVAVSGSVWEVFAPCCSGLIAPGYSRDIQVKVLLPADTVGDAVDTATIEVSSVRPLIVPVYADLTTIVNGSFALAVNAPTESKAALHPGDSISFQIQITNIGSATDTYNLAANSTWQVSLPSSIGPLGPGETSTVQVIVQVPVDASSGDVNLTTLTVTSISDPQVSSQIVLTTRLMGHLIFLPLSFKQ